ncbi:MAG: hypothetical protein JSW40_00705 [Candidatus Omnitrophota bacterium]|nr:MAG: hypothetical protein JSW40_00705 [Candidatus Omnitrophota bacterium]
MGLRGKRICIVCSDPGAAQGALLLNSALRKQGVKISVVARGAAKKIANRLGIRIVNRQNAYSGCRPIRFYLQANTFDCVITGTSLYDDLERNYIKAARKLGIYTISFIDWWTNYRQRFIHSRTNKLYLPDVVCVVDKIAARRCCREFGRSTRILITGNPYLSRIMKGRNKRGGEKKTLLIQLGLKTSLKTILYFAEPLYRGYNQFEIFQKIVSALQKVTESANTRMNLIVKFHPSGKDPYIYRRYRKIVRSILEEKCFTKFVNQQYNVGMLIESADYVWGINTTPMLEAMLKGKLVSSLLPKNHFVDIPFLKRAGFCPSADAYEQFPRLVKNLLTNEKFVRKAIIRQRRYKMPKENFVRTITTLLREN